MGDFGDHLQALAAAGFWHTWQTGHIEFWFHRRSMEDHWLMCKHPDHGPDWLNLDPGCPQVAAYLAACERQAGGKAPARG